MKNSIPRTATLKLMKIVGIYNFYARFRFHSKLNKLEGRINKIDLSQNSHNKVTNYQWNSLLIVVPSFFNNKWEAASGNLYFEMFQSAIEKYPEKNILIHFVREGEFNWINNTLETVSKLKPDVILISSEIDPNGTNEWTISKFVIYLKRVWTGKLVFIMLDSVYPLHMWRVERLAMLALNCKIIAIDRKLKRNFRKRWNVQGPVFLPISKKSLDILRVRVNKKILVEELIPIRASFVGKIYPYREKLLKVIAEKNPGFEVNPQHRMNEPMSYLSYITAITLSKFSINLSQAGGSPVRQLKWRALECLLFDSIMVSDEKKNMGLLGINAKSFIFVRNLKRLNLNNFDERKISAPEYFGPTSKLNSFFDIDL
jgi:nicotinic acid mononucleotide adenylyltransferase